MRSGVYSFNMCIRFLVASCLCWCAITAGQTASEEKIHDFTDNYQIYSLLLPHEESYRLAKGTLVIQEEMVSDRAVSERCVTPEAATRFKDAIADYRHANTQRGMLKRQFQIERSYEVVSSDTIKGLFKDGGWGGFYKRYPESGGYIVMSAVGFNKDRTRAIVYTGSSCGDLCGGWRFHLVEKIDGNWREVHGISCAMFS